MKHFRFLLAITILGGLLGAITFFQSVTAQSPSPVIEVLIDPATTFKPGDLLWEPGASANGARIVYTEYSFQPSDSQIYLYETASQTNRLISHSFADNSPNGRSFQSAISSDGLFIVFSSLATNLVPSGPANDQNGFADIFLYSLSNGSHERISNRPDGNSASGWNATPVISGDGRFTGFVSNAADILPGLVGNHSRIFLYDRRDRVIRLIAPTGLSTEREDCAQPEISVDGRFMAYTCRAEGSLQPFIYLYDRLVNSSFAIPYPENTQFRNDQQAYIVTSYPALSADGKELAILVGNKRVNEAWVFSQLTFTTAVVHFASDQQDVSLFQPQLSPNGEILTIPHHNEFGDPSLSILHINDTHAQLLW